MSLRFTVEKATFARKTFNGTIPNKKLIFLWVRLRKLLHKLFQRVHPSFEQAHLKFNPWGTFRI